jgi:hypothetical protein
MEDNRFSFYLKEEPVLCEVVTDGKHYSVYIDDQFQGILEMDEIPKWVQVTGEPMPQQIIEEIGEKIDQRFK